MIQLTLYQKIALIAFLFSIELLIVLLISVFSLVIVVFIELVFHYLIIFKLVHDAFFSGGVSLITRYHCWKLGVYLNKY